MGSVERLFTLIRNNKPPPNLPEEEAMIAVLRQQLVEVPFNQQLEILHEWISEYYVKSEKVNVIGATLFDFAEMLINENCPNQEHAEQLKLELMLEARLGPARIQYSRSKARIKVRLAKISSHWGEDWAHGFDRDVPSRGEDLFLILSRIASLVSVTEARELFRTLVPKRHMFKRVDCQVVYRHLQHVAITPGAATEHRDGNEPADEPEDDPPSYSSHPIQHSGSSDETRQANNTDCNDMLQVEPIQDDEQQTQLPSPHQLSFTVPVEDDPNEHTGSNSHEQEDNRKRNSKLDTQCRKYRTTKRDLLIRLEEDSSEDDIPMTIDHLIRKKKNLGLSQNGTTGQQIREFCKVLTGSSRRAITKGHFQRFFLDVLPLFDIGIEVQYKKLHRDIHESEWEIPDSEAL